jgi:hypothetical protein
MGKRESGFSSSTYLVVGLFFFTIFLLRDINYFYKEGSPILFFPPFLIKLRWIPWTISLAILIIVGIIYERFPETVSGNSKVTHCFHPFVENIIKYILYAVVIITLIAIFARLYFAPQGTFIPK